VIAHTQDMTLGIYYLTYQPVQHAQVMGRFARIEDVIHQVELGSIKTNDRVIIAHNGKHITTTAGRVIFNSILPEEIRFNATGLVTDDKITGKGLKKILDKTYDLCGPEVMVRVADEIKDM